MSDLILHHYAMSPFSEKIRAMLGYTGLPWQSVIVPEMPPRPQLAPLVGGYRKIPVAQIGADVFCDTRTITREIARLSGKPELTLENNDADVQAFVERVDLEVFLACVLAASDGRLLLKFARETSLLHTLRFLRDRIDMGRKAKVKPVGKKRAKAMVSEHLEHLEAQLIRDFLFGDTPCIADFSAYHGLWFVCDLAGKTIADPFPRVAAWMARIRGFGHGRPEALSSKDALTIARDATPGTVPGSMEHNLLGHPVAIAPADYGRNPTQGTLIAKTDDSWIIERVSPETGKVHVHFPRQGFSLRAEEQMT